MKQLVNGGLSLRQLHTSQRRARNQYQIPTVCHMFRLSTNSLAQ